MPPPELEMQTTRNNPTHSIVFRPLEYEPLVGRRPEQALRGILAHHAADNAASIGLEAVHGDDSNECGTGRSTVKIEDDINAVTFRWHGILR